MTPFEIKDCALLGRMSGLHPAVNLRELRDRIAICGENVLYHHFCETPLRGTFDNPDYRNDFAAWVKLYLGDRVLAERLGIVDPYAYPSLEDLRSDLVDMLDERLSELTIVPWARAGDEFSFMEATMIVFDTGDRIDHPGELASAIRGMTNSSVYYHFLEARRRPPVGVDDFSAWLAQEGAGSGGYVRALGSIDYYFHSLPHLRADILRALAEAENGP
ncbi:MAG: DUF5752 family protein [Deltaproteobacteria bacterium]